MKSWEYLKRERLHKIKWKYSRKHQFTGSSPFRSKWKWKKWLKGVQWRFNRGPQPLQGPQVESQPSGLSSLEVLGYTLLGTGTRPPQRPWCLWWHWVDRLLKTGQSLRNVNVIQSVSSSMSLCEFQEPHWSPDYDPAWSLFCFNSVIIVFIQIVWVEQCAGRLSACQRRGRRVLVGRVSETLAERTVLPSIHFCTDLCVQRSWQC